MTNCPSNSPFPSVGVRPCCARPLPAVCRRPGPDTTASGQDREILRKNFIGRVPPDLVAADADWLAGPPVTLAELHGKVVWLQFNF